MNFIRWFLPTSHPPSNNTNNNTQDEYKEEDTYTHKLSTDTSSNNISQHSNNSNTNSSTLPSDNEQSQSSTDSDSESNPEEEGKTYDSESELLDGPFETLEAEIEFLRSQNTVLQKQVSFHKKKNQRFKENYMGMNMKPLTLDGKMIKCNKPSHMTMSELSKKVHHRLPKFLQKAEHNSTADTIYIPSEIENEIGIIDIKTVDWWDMVDFNNVNTDGAMSTFNDNEHNVQYEDSHALGGPYIVLKESDVIDAIACFVAQRVINIPECRHLSHEDMLGMIDDTFADLREKGMFGRLKDYMSLTYYYYGWGSTAYTVYSNAYIAKTILSCMISAAWILGILV